MAQLRGSPLWARARSVTGGLSLALAYIVSGKLALLLALPPGYASPIFPPAGIAVAAAFVAGNRTLLWTLLGSALLNLWVGYDSTHAIGFSGIAAALFIAVASVLQAAVGGWGLRRLIGYPTSLDNVRDVGMTLLMAPATCVVSATLSVSALVGLGTVEATAFASNWFSWWIGDTLGLIVMLPLVLAFVGEPRPLWRRRIGAIVLPMLAMFTLVVFVFIQASRWEQQELMAEFEIRSQQVADDIQARFKEQEYALESVVALLFADTHRPVTRERFERALQRSLTIYPMVQAIEWAPRVTREQRAVFEAAQRKHFPEFRITEPDAGGKLKPAADRAAYYPVTYLVPVATNQAAIGLDLASTTSRRAALSGTLERGVPVATEPFRLVQEQGQQAGVLLMLGATDGANRPGVVLTVLRIGEFVSGALPKAPPGMVVQLSDDGAHRIVFGSLDGGRSVAAFERTLEFGTRVYRLETRPTAAYLARHRGWQSWIVLVVELLGTGLLGAFLLLGTGYTARVEDQVTERTESLSASRDELNEAQRLGGIGSWVLDLQQGSLAWSDEIFNIFEIDPQANPPSYELFLSAVHPEDRSIVECAYKGSVASHTPYEVEHRLLFADGRIKFIRERGETRYDSEGVPILSRGTAQDISALKAVEAALRISEERWKFALEGAGDGVWDWNMQTGELFLSKQEMTVLGYDGEPATNTHIEHWVERQHPDDRDIRRLALERYLAGEAPLYHCEFRTQARDGSWKWILARGMLASRSADGAPLRMIGTHADITERRLMEAELRRLATTDSLTGVANRRRFLEQVEVELARFKRFATPATLLMLDIDHFKLVNDTYGHAVGDAVLRHFSQLAVGRLRHIDAFGRLGGEEFAVLLPSTGRHGACEFAEQLRQTVTSSPTQSEKGDIPITLSIGVTAFTADDMLPDSVLGRADAALYRAKQNGRNRVEWG